MRSTTSRHLLQTSVNSTETQRSVRITWHNTALVPYLLVPSSIVTVCVRPLCKICNHFACGLHFRPFGPQLGLQPRFWSAASIFGSSGLISVCGLDRQRCSVALYAAASSVLCRRGPTLRVNDCGSYVCIRRRCESRITFNSRVQSSVMEAATSVVWSSCRRRSLPAHAVCSITRRMPLPV